MRRTWLLRMRWLDLLFAHWALDPSVARSLIPETPDLQLDTFDGRAWIGVVPFVMTDVAPRGVPAIPRFSTFPEVNVRTYVRHRGIPGVWFLSLDAASRPTVIGGRHAFHLPYHHAAMSARHHGETVEYRSERTAPDGSPARLTASYRPIGPVQPAEPGSFDDWSTRRMRLFASDASRGLWRTEIRHDPWPLQPAEATIDAAELVGALGIELPADPPVLRFSRRLDVRGWPPIGA
jgi:uncharacterized protein